MAWLVVVMLPSVSCTDVLLRRYRDEDLLARHRYALGEQVVELNGVRVVYQELGAGEPIVVLPGVGTSIDFWQLNLPELARHYRVLALDLPGFGKSGKPDASYELPWLCAQVLAFMDARGVERASFIGGSLGGHLGLMLALDHPERVSKVVMMGSTGMWPPPGPLLEVGLRLLWSEAVVTDHLRRAWPDIFHKLFIRHTSLTQTLFEYQMAVRADARRFAPQGRAAARALRSIFYNSCRERLEEVNTAVLLIWGQFDRVHPVRDAVYLREHLPHARLVVVPDAGHEVMIDQPQVFNDLVLAFIRRGVAGVDDQY